jgi:hypothetical protein
MVSPKQYRCQPTNSEHLVFRYVKGNTTADKETPRRPPRGPAGYCILDVS